MPYTLYPLLTTLPAQSSVCMILLCIRDEGARYFSRSQAGTSERSLNADYVIRLHLAYERNAYVHQLQPIIRGDWHIARDIIF